MCDMIQLLLILGDNDYARAVILHLRALMYHEEGSDHSLPDLQRTLDSTTEYFRGVLRSLQAGTCVF